MPDISRLTLERLALDDLPADELATVQTALDADADLRARAEAVRGALADAAIDLPPPLFHDGPVDPSALREDALTGAVV